MNKLKLLSLLMAVLCQVSFAQEIYLISTSSMCALTAQKNPNKSYLNSLNQSKEWLSYKGTNKVEENIKLKPFAFNTDVCTQTIYINEQEETRFKNIDYLTNKKTSSTPYPIIEIKDKNNLSGIKNDLLQWISNSNKSKVQELKYLKVLSGFKFQLKEFVLIEARSFTEFNEGSRKGEFSYVVLYNQTTKEFIPVETWFNKDSQETLKVENEVEGYLDIDNDGEYEIMLKSSYYEGSDSILYKIVNSKAVQKRACGCGV